MFYEGINAKVFRRSIVFTIVVVETSYSSSVEYTISVHAVHAGAERNVCNIVVSTETPKNSTNPELLLWIVYVISVLFCYAFMHVCLLMPCGHLLGKGRPLGSRL